MKDIKRLIALFLMLCILATLLPTVSFAATTASGTCGTNLTWNLNDTGTLTISGTGAMSNFSAETAPWYGSRSYIKKVIIEADTTTIGNYAFYSCYNMTDITISDSVTSIGNYAFYFCDNLTGINIPDSVTSIGNYAFSWCYGLTGITIPDSVTSIADGAFDSCLGLTSIIIPDSVTTIGYSAFDSCSGLTSITIPVSVTSIGSWAFSNCSVLTDVYYGGTADQWAQIYIDSFNTSLTDATVHYNSSNSGDGENTGSGNQVIVDSSLYPESAHNYANNLNESKSFTWPGAEKLEITFSTSTEVETNYDKIYLYDGSGNQLAVYTGKELSGTTVIIPDDTFTIKLTSDSSVQKYGYSFSSIVAFMPADIGGTFGDNLNWKLDQTGTLTISGAGTIPDFESEIETPWYSHKTDIKAIVIESGITTIGDCAFYGCDQVTEISVANTVTTIGDRAFSGCNSLTTISLPEGVSSIGQGCFGACKKLTNVVLPDSLRFVGTYAFAECSSLTNVTLGNSLTYINEGMFNNTKLTVIVIPDSVTRIESGSFFGCNCLTTVTIPVSVTYIDEYAFYQAGIQEVYYGGSAADWAKIYIGEMNSPLTKATLHTVEPTVTNITIKSQPDKVTYWVGETLDTTGLVLTATYSDGTTVDITDGFTTSGFSSSASGRRYVTVTYEGKSTTFLVTVSALLDSGTCGENLVWTLDDTNTLTISGTGTMDNWSTYSDVPWSVYRNSIYYVIIENDVTSIGDYAFTQCLDLRNVTIGNNVKSIGKRAFDSCISLYSIAIPNGVTTIGEGAFVQCQSLQAVSIPASVISIGEGAFNYCWNSLGFGVNKDNPAYSSDDSHILFNKDKTALIQAPYCLSGEYTVPESVITICDDAFYSCKDMTGITIPVSVTSIGDWAFYDCSSLTDVYYDGTATQWAKITIGSANTGLTDANIHTAEPTLTEISVTVQPDKVVYWVGETLDTTGLVLTATYNDGTTAAITDGFTVSGFDSAIAGNQSITVTYEEKTTTFTVIVNQPVITDLLIKTNPDKLVYWVGETLDTTGLVLTATYSDGNDEIVTEGFTVSGFDSSTAGDQIVTVTYEDKTAIFIVTVNEPYLTDISINTQPDKLAYWIGERLDITGLSLTAFYSDGSSKTVTEGFTVSGFDSSTAGDQTITVAYEEKIAIFTVTVNEPYLTDISINTKPYKVVYLTGENLDITGLTLTAIYSDNSTETVTEGFTVSGFDSTTAGHITVTVTYEDKTASFEVSVVFGGICGQKLNWTLDDQGTLTISGTGAMDRWTEPDEAPWYDYIDSVNKVVIKEGVTDIGKYAFSGYIGLTEVEIPDSVTSIGNYAFQSCDNLSKVAMGDGVASIGAYAFSYCESLTSLTIGSSVTNINTGAFRNCTNLELVSFGNSVIDVCSNAFYKCTTLKNVNYYGTQSQWAQIAIKSGNDCLTAANIVYICKHPMVVGGICTGCGEFFAAAIINSQGNESSKYTTFSEALEAASSGDTVSLLDNAVVSNLMLSGGVNLELNGYTMTADSVLTFGSSHIIDSSENNTGILKINDADGNMINDKNSQLPVYDTANGGYRFFAIDMESCAVTGDNKYWFKIKTENFAPLYELINSGSEVQIKVKLTWDGQSEETYAVAGLAFTKIWANRCNESADVYITVTVNEAEALENFKLIPIITSSGVEIAGEEM